MNNFTSAPDLTAIGNRMSTGLAIKRSCWTCNKPSQVEGGYLNKRTRAWHCASCRAQQLATKDQRNVPHPCTQSDRRDEASPDYQ